MNNNKTLLLSIILLHKSITAKINLFHQVFNPFILNLLFLSPSTPYYKRMAARKTLIGTGAVITGQSPPPPPSLSPSPLSHHTNPTNTGIYIAPSLGIPLPNPFRTSMVKRIEEKHATAAGTPVGTSTSASPRGNAENVKKGGRTDSKARAGAGINTEYWEQSYADQRSPVSWRVFQWGDNGERDAFCWLTSW